MKKAQTITFDIEASSSWPLPQPIELIVDGKKEILNWKIDKHGCYISDAIYGPIMILSKRNQRLYATRKPDKGILPFGGL